MPRKEVYYCVHVSSSGRVKWRWSPPFSRATDAANHGKDLHADGQASLYFVVLMDHEGKKILPGSTGPRPAKKIVLNFLELEEMLDDHTQNR